MNCADEGKMLTAAVIGVGAMGQHHARVYDHMPATQLVGVADMDAEVGERIAHLSQPYPTVAYTDYRRLLDETHPDIVTVAVPTTSHHLVAMDALDAGCHVLIEKPIAENEEQAQELIRAAKVLGRKLMVGHIVRFGPAIQELKRRLMAGELGYIIHIRCRRLGPFPARIRDVGVVIDLATHDLDLIRYITGQEAVRVYAETQRRVSTNHEDILAAAMRLTDGTICILDVNWLTPVKVRELTVTGKRGMFLVNHITQDLYLAKAKRYGYDVDDIIHCPVRKYEPLKAELEGFVQSVIEDKPVPVSGEDGLAALRLALALVRSGREERIITLNTGV